MTLVRVAVMRKKMGFGIQTLVAEEAEQDHEARADSEQADDNVDEHQWPHARWLRSSEWGKSKSV